MVIREISLYTSLGYKWFSEVPRGLNCCLLLLSQDDNSATLIVHDAGLSASPSVIFSIYCFISLSSFALLLCSCNVGWSTILVLPLKCKVECPVSCLCLCLELWINSLDDSVKFLFWLVAEGEGGGGVSTTFCVGRPRPEVQPFTLLYMYTIFERQGITFAYLFWGGNVMYGSVSHNYLLNLVLWMIKWKIHECSIVTIIVLVTVLTCKSCR